MDDMWIDEDLEMALAALKKDGVILYPTDTIWGLGCDATSEKAVEKLYKLKRRDPEKPCIVLVDSVLMLKKFVDVIHPRIETLLSLHERPLTIVYPGVLSFPEKLTGKKESVAIRVVQDPFCQELIRRLGKPIVSTSANIAQESFPKSFGEIDPSLVKAVDYSVKYRQGDLTKVQPSVIAKYNKKGVLEFLRT